MADILQNIKINNLKTQQVADFAQKLSEMISTLHINATHLERRVKFLEDSQQTKDTNKNKWHKGYLSAEADLPALLARL